jgi:rhodanese-related sulfurtransferase
MNEQIPEPKQTVLGLYVTSAEAYEKWKAAPDKVKLLDVRTPEEFIFVGHPEMARCVPLGYQSYRWDEEKGYFDLDVNPHFVAQVREWFDPDETVMLMCRSGGRSAMAVNLLVQAGYTDAWNITDGMEGDMDDGKRTKNGWKNANLPWTYEVNPERMCLPGDEPVSIKTEV